MIGISSAQPKVVESLGVDGEKPDRCAVFRRHVRYRRAIGEAEVGEPRAIEFHEFSNYTFGSQHLCDGEYNVRRSRTLPQLARYFETDDAWNQHGKRLAEHRTFGLNSTHTPAYDAEPVDHCCVRIRSDESVR